MAHFVSVTLFLALFLLGIELSFKDSVPVTDLTTNICVAKKKDFYNCLQSINKV